MNKSSSRSSAGLPRLPLALLLVLAGCGAPGGNDAVEVVHAAMTSGVARVNCGGPAVGAFVADTNFSGGGTVTRANTIDLSGVSNPAPAAVYQSQRNGNMSYTFSGFTAGTPQTVRLHFADTHWTTANQRLFDVAINGTTVLSNFDIVGIAGAGNRALVESFVLPANGSGAFVIQFTTVRDAAMISGIEILSGATSGLAMVDCGGPAVAGFVADTNFSGGATITRNNGIDVSGVTDPAPVAVYQSQRYGNMTYTFGGFNPGLFKTVRLHFADTHWTTAGNRSFNVSINGSQVLTSFDVVAAAGAGNKAVVRTFKVGANAAGNFVIDFVTVKDAATISGIEITPWGYWQKDDNDFPGGGVGSLQLLMDGTVLASDVNNRANWYRFTPDPVAGYSGGHWAAAASSKFGRAYFSSGMLSDGRYIVCGGEYVRNADGTDVDPVCYPGGGCFYPSTNPCGPTPPVCVNHNTCEIFDPVLNNWVSTPNYPPANTYLSDSVSTVLPNGRLLFAAPQGPSSPGNVSQEFDPAQCPQGWGACAASPWTSQRTVPPSFFFTEGSMTLMQNDKAFYTGNGASIYDPSNLAWSPIVIPPPPVNPYSTVLVEGGPALTLYDGRIVIAGSTGFNGIFDPNAFNPATGAFGASVNIAATPGGSLANLPVKAVRLDENDQVVMPNGDLLFDVIQNDFSGPYRFYEYSPPTPSAPLGVFGDVTPDAPVLGGGCNVLSTPLPDGYTMVAHSCSKPVYRFVAHAFQQTAFGQPSITNVTGPVNSVFTMTGTGLNGLTNGANRDDEGQNYTSFPVVSLTTASGQVRYANVIGLSTRSIAPRTPVTVKFTVPNDLRGVPVTVNVSASGLHGSNSVVIQQDGNIALGKTVTTQTTTPGFPGSLAVDGNTSTYWASLQTETPNWVIVDLGAPFLVHGLLLQWGATRFATSFQIQTSSDQTLWTTVNTTTNARGNDNPISGLNTVCRYIKLNLSLPSGGGYSLKELQVLGQQW